MPSSLEKSVIATICYYDVLNYPLTAFEIYKYLININQTRKISKDVSFFNIKEVLENSSELKKNIRQENGFYFLKGRKEIIEEHIWRKKIADEKWKKAKRIIWFLQIVPFARMIAVSGSLALGNPHQESDIDLLMVTKSGRIWTCRTFITILATFLGVRRHGKITRDKICLNHYITDRSLKISFQSLYNAQTYARLIPALENQISVFKEFQKDNFWLKDFLLFYPRPITKNLRMIRKNMILKTLAEFSEIILAGRAGNFLENFLGKYEKARIESDPLKKSPGGRIIAEESQLEFHPNSPEKRIIRDFNERIKKIGFWELACQRDSGLVK